MEETKIFLGRLHGKKVCGDTEDMVFLDRNKEWEILCQIPLQCPRAVQPFFIPLKLHLERVGVTQD